MSEVELSGSEENESGESKAKKLTEAEWGQIVEAYELGIKGIVELSREYGCTRQNLSTRFKNHGIVKGSRSHELKDAVKQAAVNNAVQAAAQAETFADRRVAWIEETRQQGYQLIKQASGIAAKAVIDAVKGGASVASVDDELKAIRRFQSIIIEGVEARLVTILRADETVDVNELPQLPIVDLTAEDIITHHQNIGALDEDTDIEELMQSVDQDLKGMVTE